MCVCINRKLVAIKTFPLIRSNEKMWMEKNVLENARETNVGSEKIRKRKKEIRFFRIQFRPF